MQLHAEGIQSDFSSLSLKDLLEARDLYHFHLINKPHVIGTAVGRYLIRRGTPWPSAHQPRLEQEGKAVSRKGLRQPRKPPRTFDNSEVRDYSWPAVLALVDQWIDEEDFIAHNGVLHPQEIVPKTLYLPDGRMVPVCVVAVTPVQPLPPALPHWVWPQTYIGPGYPILIHRQGADRHASIGCLVTDGQTTYALTNRHACGDPGEPVYSMMQSKRVRIGRASEKMVTRLLFNEVYPDFPSRRTYVNLDIGLAEIEDCRYWTSRVYGLPKAGPVAEINESNLRLNLVNAKVVAHGAASGKLEGEIKALFYRYKSVSGFDYVADFLISPQNLGGGTQPGDSGTVWHLVPTGDDRLLRPLAVEWGGQAFAAHASPGQYRFALATALSNACRYLDVDLVRGDDVTVRPFWGQTGHYDIAAAACGVVQSAGLKKLMDANLDRVSFAKASLDPNDIRDALSSAKKDGDQFVPLADVPDIVWKAVPSKMTGGRDRPAGLGRTTGPEHPNHYADIDEPDDKGKTLRALSLQKDENIAVDYWRTFYDERGHSKAKSRGLLPFRVWQHWDTMVAALEKKNAQGIAEFVCAAGILSHYVGDACQPLHGSMHADGFMDRKTSYVRHHRDGSEEEIATNVGAGVHSGYESNMIDRFADVLLESIDTALQKRGTKLPAISDGRGAAKATLQLMERTANLIPPTDLIQTWLDAGGKKTVVAYEQLWDAWGDKTAATMADGARVLAWIWECAWRKGGGEKLPKSLLAAVDQGALFDLYTDAEFLPSLDLDHIGPILK